MVNIFDYDIQELSDWMKTNGESEFRSKQVMLWLYKGCNSFSEMTNLPKGLIEKLNKEFSIEIPEIIQRFKSTDGFTDKFLLRLRDGNVIESVVMKYKYGNSICVSSQIGCRMGCKFCASTIGGLVRNLTCGEIITQVLACQKSIGERISHIVIMGSGEPLDNYNEVIKFIKIIKAPFSLNIGERNITVSTCGIVEKIYELAQRKMQITLAISLHAPEDELRKKLMPIGDKYKIEDILEACRYYINVTNKRVTFEYALIKGENDGKEQAFMLARLLKGMLCHVNLIPVNHIDERGFKGTESKNVLEFQRILTINNIETTIRRKMGIDINAACGQLRRSFLDAAK